MSSPSDGVSTMSQAGGVTPIEIYKKSMLEVENGLLTNMNLRADLKDQAYKSKQEEIVARLERLRILKKMIDELLALPDEKGKVDTTKSPKLTALLEEIKKYEQTTVELENKAKELNEKAQKLLDEANTLQASNPQKADLLKTEADACKNEAKNLTLTSKELEDILSCAQALLKKTSFTVEERNQLIGTIRSTMDMVDTIQKSANVELSQIKFQSDELRTLTKSLMDRLDRVANDMCRNIK